jgi:hypothetical protein
MTFLAYLVLWIVAVVLLLVFLTGATLGDED